MKKHLRKDLIDRVAESWESRFPDWDVSGLQLALRLGSLARAHQARCEEITERYGMGAAGFPTLALVATSPDGMTPSALMMGTKCPSGTVAHRLQILERAGLVRREVDPQDRRSFRIHITPLGLARLEACAKEYLPALDEPFGGLSRSERRELENLLRKMGKEDEA